MSANTPSEENTIATAKADLAAYIGYFEKRYGYGLKINSELTLTKLDNGNNPTKETRKGNRTKRPKAKA